jgi:1-acyl-sn-glycerol-3-phosphate acyltransferase
MKLEAGSSVGLFPEGTTNRDPHELLHGYPGAARLSLETGAPLVPTGLVYPGYTGLRPVEEKAAVKIRFGAPMHPGAAIKNPSNQEVRAWHERMMREISQLSGKRWQPGLRRQQKGPSHEDNCDQD